MNTSVYFKLPANLGYFRITATAGKQSSAKKDGRQPQNTQAASFKAIRLATLAMMLGIFISTGNVTAMGAALTMNSVQPLTELNPAPGSLLASNQAVIADAANSSGNSSLVTMIPGNASLDSQLPEVNSSTTPNNFNVLKPGLGDNLVDPHDICLFPTAGFSLAQGQPVYIPLNSLKPVNYKMYFSSTAGQFWSLQSPGYFSTCFLWTAPNKAVAEGRLKIVPFKSTGKTLYSGLFSVGSKQWSNVVDCDYVLSKGAVSLNWQPVAAPPNTVTYNIYRSTSTQNLFSAGNLIVSGLASTSIDIDCYPDGQTYYYLVTPIHSTWQPTNIYPPVSTVVGNTLTEQLGTTTAKLNGQTFTLEHAPTIIGPRVYIPLVSTVEAMGQYASFDPATQTAMVDYYGTWIQYTAGSSIFTVNGEEWAMDAPAYVDNGAFMLPPHNLCEPLGFSVCWEAATHTIYICFP